MDEILHTLWQINYKRDNPVTLTILHVYPNHDIAGIINHSSSTWSFSNYRECINLLETFEKGILTGASTTEPSTNIEQHIPLSTVFKAIDDEPEYPDDMPDKMWDEMVADKDTAEEAMRITVRLTKSGIKNRIKDSIAP